MREAFPSIYLYIYSVTHASGVQKSEESQDLVFLFSNLALSYNMLSTYQTTFELFILCAAMFLGAFLAGLSCYKLNRRQLAWVNCFAAGILLGTALGVIIPEGVRAIYEGNEHTAHDHSASEEHSENAHSENKHPERLLGRFNYFY